MRLGRVGARRRAVVAPISNSLGEIAHSRSKTARSWRWECAFTIPSFIHSSVRRPADERRPYQTHRSRADPIRVHPWLKRFTVRWFSPRCTPDGRDAHPYLSLRCFAFPPVKTIGAYSQLVPITAKKGTGHSARPFAN